MCHVKTRACVRTLYVCMVLCAVLCLVVRMHCNIERNAGRGLMKLEVCRAVLEGLYISCNDVHY